MPTRSRPPKAEKHGSRSRSVPSFPYLLPPPTFSSLLAGTVESLTDESTRMDRTGSEIDQDGQDHERVRRTNGERSKRDSVRPGSSRPLHIVLPASLSLSEWLTRPYTVRIRFSHDGVRVQDDDTPESLGIEDGDGLGTSMSLAPPRSPSHSIHAHAHKTL